MKRLFRGRARIVIVAALLLTLVLAMVSNIWGVDIPGIVVKSVMQPLRYGANALMNQAEEIYSYLFRYEALAEENAQLKAQISEMEDAAQTAGALERENERLRALLDLQAEREDFVLVDAYITSWDSTDWSSSYTISRGSGSGVEEGQCVITAYGEVVGLITEVGPNYAVFKSVLDSSLEISATIVSTGSSGMVHGSYLAGEAGMLRMDYLPVSSALRNKDQVVTAGSTVYPRDLIIGYIVDAGFNDSGASKYAVLQPAADMNSLEQVFVVTDYNAE